MQATRLDARGKSSKNILSQMVVKNGAFVWYNENKYNENKAYDVKNPAWLYSRISEASIVYLGFQTPCEEV